MQYIYSCIDQLDLAATQLHQNHPAYRRFGLILTDNAIELMAFRRCQDAFKMDTFGEGTDKYPAEMRASILGNDFGEKIKFLRRLDLLANFEEVFILRAHAYRNEAYHSGIVHDDLMHPLAWQYHKLACDLFVRLRPRGAKISFRGPDVPSPAVRKHLGGEMSPLIRDDEFKKAASSLNLARPMPEPSLGESLAMSAIRRIQEIENKFAYIVKHELEQPDDERAIFEIQFRHDIDEEWSGRTFKLPDMAKELKETKTQAFAKFQQWRPRITHSPFQRWKKRANGLQRAKNCGSALATFENLGRDLAYFEKVVSGSYSASFLEGQAARLSLENGTR